jgi:CBS domain-containing protein
MKCKDIMKTDIECVSPSSTIQTAAHMMREENVGFLPVCNQGMRCIGTITDRDIAIRAVAEGLPSNTAVDSLMTTEVISCSPEDDLAVARELMAANQKSRIVCVNDNGRIEGVISLSDIAQLDEVSASDTLRQVSSREARSDGLYAS